MLTIDAAIATLKIEYFVQNKKPVNITTASLQDDIFLPVNSLGAPGVHPRNRHVFAKNVFKHATIVIFNMKNNNNKIKTILKLFTEYLNKQSCGTWQHTEKFR